MFITFFRILYSLVEGKEVGMYFELININTFYKKKLYNITVITKVFTIQNGYLKLFYPLIYVRIKKNIYSNVLYKLV